MPDDVVFEMQGMKELVAKTGRLNGELGPIVRSLLLESAFDIEGRAKELAPIDTGRLWSSLKPGHENNIQRLSAGVIPDAIVVGTNVHYARHVEYGTKPHWAPFNAFNEWGRRHAGKGRFAGWKASEVAATAWWAVGMRGTKPKPFLRPGFEQAKPDIEKNIEEVKAKIEAIWRGK